MDGVVDGDADDDGGYSDGNERNGVFDDGDDTDSKQSACESGQQNQQDAAGIAVIVNQNGYNQQ